MGDWRGGGLLALAAVGALAGRLDELCQAGPRPPSLEPPEGSAVAGIYGSAHISERHRHRYEVNINYRKQLEAHGMVAGSGRRRLFRSSRSCSPALPASAMHCC